MNSDQDGKLLFRFSEMEKEITNISELAKGFLAPGAEKVLAGWLNELKGFKANPYKGYKWQIRQEWPVRTRLSNGECELKRRGGLQLWGELSCVWEISAHNDKGKGKAKAGQCFLLDGLASTRIRIFEEGKESDEIASWQFEAGCVDSPGCYFHVHVLGEQEINPFPKRLPVPRLPGILITPMDGLEFLLGEIFQLEWKKKVSENSGELTLWSSAQRDRLANILRWNLERVLRAGGSPWANLKSGKPSASIFVGGK